MSDNEQILHNICLEYAKWRMSQETYFDYCTHMKNGEEATSQSVQNMYCYYMEAKKYILGNEKIDELFDLEQYF